MAALPKATPRKSAPAPTTSLAAPESLGVRLRAEREKKGIALRELARRISVSPSLISQIERGLATPSVGTLYALASALGIELDTLFRDSSFSSTKQSHQQSTPTAGSVTKQLIEPKVGSASPASPASAHVQRGASRKCIRLAGGVAWERLTAQADEHVEFLLVRYEVGAESCPKHSLVRHGGKEYAFVTSGCLGVQIGLEKYELTAGDSMSFDSQIPHRLWAIGNEPATAIWAIVNRTHDVRGAGST